MFFYDATIFHIMNDTTNFPEVTCFKFLKHGISLRLVGSWSGLIFFFFLEGRGTYTLPYNINNLLGGGIGGNVWAFCFCSLNPLAYDKT